MNTREFEVRVRHLAGNTVAAKANLHCGHCDGAGFSYQNGAHTSLQGVRGYRCMCCGAIKPERGLCSWPAPCPEPCCAVRRELEKNFTKKA
ncbi:MAG: hypothetical protein M0P73_16325 [Syntrophobacterales bacterium]|jgi:hypothetical protein|nr:hypothetical protein [Syntrophobacterales bacterium]